MCVEFSVKLKVKNYVYLVFKFFAICFSDVKGLATYIKEAKDPNIDQLDQSKP